MNWLATFGAVVVLVIIALIVALALVLPPPSPTPALGSTKTAGDGEVMMFVPAGEFLMGSRDADELAGQREKPQHTVYLNSFWIGKYDVTNVLYKKCVDAGQCTAPRSWVNRAIPSGKENHPVTGVSWDDAIAYAQWVGGRLPTEAEWEKAACWDEAKKAKRIYPWGNDFDAQKANTRESGIGDTTEVGRYSPQGDSPYGVSDMGGNVWEWVADWYSETYYSSSPKNNPKGPDSASLRSVRGGSWDGTDVSARCTYRYYFDPGYQYGIVGFRVAESFAGEPTGIVTSPGTPLLVPTSAVPVAASPTSIVIPTAAPQRAPTRTMTPTAAPSPTSTMKLPPPSVTKVTPTATPRPTPTRFGFRLTPFP